MENIEYTVQIAAVTNLLFVYRIDVNILGSESFTEGYFEHSKPYTVGLKIKVKIIDADKHLVAPSDGYTNPEYLDSQVHECLHKLPKTEIHLHLEGLITQATLKKLNKLKDNEKLGDNYRLSEHTSLSEFINKYIFIQNSITAVSDYTYLVQDLRDYMIANNLRYAEIYIAISTPIKNGLTYAALVDQIETDLTALEKETNMQVRVLIDLSRTFGVKNAMDNLDNVIDHPSSRVIGISLGGDETKYHTKDFKKVFEKAKKNGFHTVAHAGEDAGPHFLAGANSVREAIEDLGAERIGHGIGAVEDEKLLLYLKQERIPLEICITSNCFTKRYSKDIESHPIQVFKDRELNITINSDDPTLFDTNITEEYFKLYKHLGFPLNYIEELIRNGIDATFYEHKALLKEEFQKEIDRIKTEYPVLIF